MQSPLTFVRGWHNFITEQQRLYEEAFPTAERPLPRRSRRRSLLRSRHLTDMAAAGSRLAPIVGFVLPVIFTIGWLYQAGILAGYGVPYSLVTPDPVRLATFAISLSVAALTGVALYAAPGVALYALYAGAAKLSVSIRAALIIASLPVALALFAYSFVDFDTFVPLGFLYAMVLGAIYIGPYFSWKVEWRDLGIRPGNLVLVAVLLLLGSFPAGWLIASRPPEISGESVTLTLNEKLAGVPGTRVGGGCAYEDVELVQVDTNGLIFRRHGDRSAWVVPMSNVISIAVRPPDLDGPPC